MKESRGFMNGLNGMFNCAFGVLEFWRETIMSSMFGREHFQEENGILRTSMGAMGKKIFYCFVQFLFVPLSNF